MPPPLFGARARQQQTLEAAGFKCASRCRSSPSPASSQSQPKGPWKRVSKSVAVLSNIDHSRQQAYERTLPSYDSHSSASEPERGKPSLAHTAMRLLPPPLAQPVARAPSARSAAEVWARALNEFTVSFDDDGSGASGAVSAGATVSASTPCSRRDGAAGAADGCRLAKRARTVKATRDDQPVPPPKTAMARRARRVLSAPAYSSSARAEVRQLTSRAGLMDSRNLITHSDVHDRTQLYTTAARGHQENASGKDSMPVSRNFWLKARATKLQAQAEEATSDVLRGVRAYITGYTEGTTHRELSRLIHAHGGHVELHAHKHVTHTVSSMALSARKMHAANTRHGQGAYSVGHLVRPEWVLDSVARASRQPEKRYGVPRSAVSGVAAAPIPAAPHSSDVAQTSLCAFVGGGSATGAAVTPKG